MGWVLSAWAPENQLTERCHKTANDKHNALQWNKDTRLSDMMHKHFPNSESKFTDMLKSPVWSKFDVKPDQIKTMYPKLGDGYQQDRMIVEFFSVIVKLEAESDPH